MIIKNIFKIHLLYYIVGFIFFITGLFKEFIIFSSIIIVHEMGHIIAAIICKWHIEKVILLPFGGLTIFKEPLNKPLKEELFITIMGPLFQIFFYFLIGDNNILFKQYNIAILLFNLLPICPLDGSKIINIVLNKCSSFKKSYNITIILSIITLIICSYYFNLLFLTVLLFLLIETIKLFIKRKYYYNRFLLERYLYDFKFKKEKIINDINKMAKEKKHLFYLAKKYYSEKEILTKMFDNR
ncbi:MAG: site-2 protease family protein [Bacilli bacterium]